MELFICLATRSAIISQEEWENNRVNTTDNHILLVVPGVEAIEHQTKALDDLKRTPAVGDHEQRVATDLPESLQPFTEGLTRVSSSSTHVSK